jgi:hypothetical protein
VSSLSRRAHSTHERITSVPYISSHYIPFPVHLFLGAVTPVLLLGMIGGHQDLGYKLLAMEKLSFGV